MSGPTKQSGIKSVRKFELLLLTALTPLLVYQNCSPGSGQPFGNAMRPSTTPSTTTTTLSSTTSTTRAQGTTTSTTSSTSTTRRQTTTTTSSTTTTTKSTVGIFSNGCVRGCEHVFQMAEAGQYNDPQTWPAKCKAGNSGIDEWNKGPGSQNWPVVCRSAEYMMTKNATWFTEFMRAQKTTLGHGARELFSPLYSHHTIGPILGVLREAKKNNHAELENLTKDWLRAYWALLSLGAIPRNQSTVVVRVEGKPFPQPDINGLYTGLSIAIPGPRANDWSAAGSLMPPMLSFALDFTPRKWTKAMQVDSWYSHILNFFLALDANLTPTNALQDPSQSFAPEKFGLTSTERSLLKGFVNNPDPGSLNAITGMIEPYFPHQPITFVRTTSGIYSYFGDSDRATATNPNPNKCPFFIVHETNSGQYTAYHPHHHDKGGCPQGLSGRTGQQICAQGHTFTDCVTVEGTVIYEVVWRKNGNVGSVERIR